MIDHLLSIVNTKPKNTLSIKSQKIVIFYNVIVNYPNNVADIAMT